MFTNIRYILLTALRDWLFVMLMAGLLTCVFISHMLGGTALIETQEMTIAYTSASARVLIITGLIVFTCFHVRNAFDTREIDVFLSRPITRSSLVFSYWFGFAVVATLLVIPTLIFIALQGTLSGKGFFFWSVSLMLECWLMVAVALFFAFTLKSSVTSTIASMGFYVFTRMMGFFIAMLQTTPGLEQQVLKFASVVLPRLDYFARSEWLVYGMKDIGEFRLYAAQAIICIPFLVLLTIIDFRRKQF